MSDTSLTISIALCTYNGEAYLREQLDSILAQTVVPDELIVCDDASTDGTMDILDSFKGTCPFPVSIIANTDNVGYLKNFENAITLCCCDIILLADQDDFWLPSKVETIRSSFLEHLTCGYVFSNAELVDEDSRPVGMDLWNSVGFNQRRYKHYVAVDRQLGVMLKGGNFIYGTTLAFRASFKHVLLPIESCSFDCAHDTWICLILSALGAYGVAVPKSLIQYRQHGKQLAGAGRSNTLAESLKIVCTDKAEYYRCLAETLDNIRMRIQDYKKDGTHRTAAIIQLAEKAEHLRARSLAGSSKGLERLRIVCRELISGRYGRYSRSAKSVLKDLIL